MADNVLATTQIGSGSGMTLTPRLTNLAQNEYRIEIQGVMEFAGRAFDAVYRAGTDGRFTEKHAYLKWNPQMPVIEAEDPIGHRYVFRIPSSWSVEGQSVSVGLNVDRFVDEFLIAPSEVQRDLSGSLQMTVLQRVPVTGFPWTSAALAAAPAIALTGGVAWVIRRRMLLGGLDYDLQEALARMATKRRAALRALKAAPTSMREEMGQQLAGLEQSAAQLARQVQRLRKAGRLIDHEQIERDASRQRPGDAVSQVANQEKHSVLEMHRSMKETEGRCTARLSTLESTLDRTILALATAGVAHESPAEMEQVRRELTAEVEAIHVVAREAEEMEIGRMVVVSR